jgi:AraC-like DNA-binding protein
MLEVDEHFAKMGHVVHCRVAATDQINDGALAEVFNVLRALCGSAWKPTEVHLTRRMPADVRPFKKFFKVPLRFDADCHAVVFSADWLGRPLPALDTELRDLMTKEIRRLEHVHGDDFPEQIRSVLRSSIATGEVSAGNIAALFSIQPRTLARRLASAGTGFRELLDETRFAAARQMLEDTSLNINQIAAGLGYARSSVFIRSFRRWSSHTPAAWRAQHDRAESAPTGPPAQ